MIVPMFKYSFLLFHQDYDSFLEDVQDLGILHVAEKEIDLTEEMTDNYAELNSYEKAIQILKNRGTAGQVNTKDDGIELSPETVIHTDSEIVLLENKLEELKNTYEKCKPWGNFSTELIEKLETENINLHFYKCQSKQFEELHNSGLPVALISEQGTQVLFVFVHTQTETIDIDAERVQLPAESVSELERRMELTKNNIEKLNKELDEYALFKLPSLQKRKSVLFNSLEYKRVILNTEPNADNKLMLLEGWIPKSKSAAIDSYLEKNTVLYIRGNGSPNDKIPVLLKNNWFSTLFEPIGSMFSLPDYAEIDLTLFFAPFFMMFFGFCLGDAGYGILFLLVGSIYKVFAKSELKPYLTLLQFLGLGTIVFGIISGTFFGINLIETDLKFTDNFRNLFLDPNKMFQLSLVLGGLQIIFGQFLKAANQAKQFGFRYALSTCGWLVIILGSLLFALLVKTEVIPQNPVILYVILSTGGFFVLFFSDPEINIFARIGKGIWDIYSTVTGIFGDLLSYIRLFALGLSSAILGFVINDIGLQILGSSKIFGPVFFLIFLVLGHTLNILISSLGSFVHPMRLTFVEFYKNAGFKGGGEAYKPFSKEQQ